MNKGLNTIPVRVRRPVHGLLLLDKPLGLSSNQALQKVKRLFAAEKAGHTGTLDPLATGVLPLCLGAATKFSQLHLDADKTYETTLGLGVRTSTADAEGQVIETKPVTCSLEQVQHVLKQFTGLQQQVPPMHSALKKDGKALYEYAREGLTLERSAREVTIHAIELLGAQLHGCSPCLRLRVRCSKGTYIRTLGEDIAQALGCGGHLQALRRVATGPYVIEQCLSLDALHAMTEAERMQCLLPVSSLLQGHERIALSEADATRFLCGLRRRGAWQDAAQVAVYGPVPTLAQSPSLLGTAYVRAGELIPNRLMSPVEIKQTLSL